MRLLGQFFFFIIRFQKHKTNYSEQKFKNMHKTHLREKKLLICLFPFCAFILLVLLVKLKSLNGLKKLVFMSLPIPLN